MRNSKLRAFLIALMLLVFAAGLAFLLYPSLWGAAVDQKISLNAQGFLNRDETAPTIPDVIVTVDSPWCPRSVLRSGLVFSSAAPGTVMGWPARCSWFPPAAPAPALKERQSDRLG